MKYEIIIDWSETDGTFIAEVPELPGCCADGPTKAKALVAVEKIARESVEREKESGRPIPKPKGLLARNAQITRDVAMMRRALQEHAEEKSRP